MNYIIPPENNITWTAWWDNIFTDDELNFLQAKAKQSTQNGQIGNDNSEVINLDYRSAKVDFLDCTNETVWLYEKLSHVVSNLNASYFKLDLLGFGERIQLCNYISSERGKYDWHLDLKPQGISRKLSLVCQLSHPDEYEGGEFQYKISEDEFTVHKKRGFITVFPSYILHRVTPVTSGTRQSLVCWITGPSFR